MNKEVVKNLLARPIAFHRIFADIAGSAAGGIFLSQLFYWSDKGMDPEGWIFKTRTEWEAETALTRYEQERARAALVSLGILEEERRGLPCKLYFRLNMDKLMEQIMAPVHITVNEHGEPVRARRKESVPPQLRAKRSSNP